MTSAAPDPIGATLDVLPSASRDSATVTTAAACASSASNQLRNGLLSALSRYSTTSIIWYHKGYQLAGPLQLAAEGAMLERSEEGVEFSKVFEIRRFEPVDLPHAFHELRLTLKRWDRDH